MAGGGIFAKKLQQAKKQAESLKGKTLEVGFFSGSTYPDGTKVAEVAYIQEFGTTINVSSHTKDINFKVQKNGKSRFAKKDKANFQQTVTVPAHTVVIPPRPFFRNAITEHKSEWVKSFKSKLKAKNPIERSLEALGTEIVNDIKNSIKDLKTPPLAKSTIKSKKSKGSQHPDNPLLDTERMLHEVRAVVKNGD